VPAAGVDINRLSSLRRGLPGLAMLGASALRRLAAVDGGDVAGAVRGVSDLFSRQAELAERRRHGESSVDEFGFDQEWTESLLLPLSAWVYRNWWRVRAVGVENVPSSGRGLLVANHAGIVPYDGAMVRTALLLEHPQPRHARALVLNGLFSMPAASWLIRRTGNTMAHNDDACRLLERDELVPAGLIPLPSSWIIEFHEPVDVSNHGPDAAGDPSTVLAISDQVRDVIQAGVYANLQRRQSVFALS
jgi:hypothetical protein